MTRYRIYLDGGNQLTDDALAELSKWRRGLDPSYFFAPLVSSTGATLRAEELARAFPDSLVTIAVQVDD